MKTTYIFENEIETVNSEPDDCDSEYIGLDSKLICDINKYIKESLEEGEMGLAKYPPDNVEKTLLLSIKPKVVLMDNKPYCRCIVTTSREMTNEEIEIVKDDLLAQYSDGWGEGFSQFPVHSFYMTYEEEEYDEDKDEYYTEKYDFKSEVFVNFWLSIGENKFNVYKVNDDGQDELIEGDLEISDKKNKIRVKLIGEDGNIFNLSGIAYKELKRAGLYDEGKKMLKEIENSNSYDEALRVIMDYVTVY